MALPGAPVAGASGAAPAVRGPVGDLARVPSGALDLGPLTGSTPVSAVVVLKPRDPGALGRAAAAVSTPGSPGFRHFVTPSQFASDFGATSATVGAVESTLRSEGLAVSGPSSNQMSLTVSGSAATVARAFGVHLDAYRLAGGQRAFANRQAPTLPASVAPDVQAVIGLDTTLRFQPLGLDRPRPGVHRPGAVSGSLRLQPHTGGPQPCSAATSDGSAYGSYTADQLAAAYGFNSLYGVGDLGAGTAVGLFELEPDAPADVAAYQACYGTSASVTYTKVDGGSGSGFGSGEAALDIEDVVGLAPKALIRVFQGPNSGIGVYDTYNAMIGSGGPRVISTSWGLCEAQTGSAFAASEESLFQEAALQGQTVVAAQGDSGSTDCTDGQGNPLAVLGVDDPASDPYVTGIGGTTLTLDGSDQRATETTWNESDIDGGAGGGGVSELWTMAAYQSGASGSLGVVNANSSGATCGAPSGVYCRESPDVSADADPYTGYVIYYGGGWTAIGGTSAAAPLWGALTAEADSSAQCAPAGPVGLLGPDVYYLAGTSAANYSAGFYDVPSGSNNDYLPSNYTGGLYPSKTGYDMATGLGTPNAAGLVPLLCGPTVTGLAPASGPAAGGGSVTITGTRFSTIPGDTTVQFGASAPISAEVVSATQITATAPAGTGAVPVSVVVGGDQSPASPADLYSYVPAVTAVSPSSGPTSGGTVVSIAGAGFAGASSVKFGTTIAASFTVVSPTQITATSPTGAASTVDVTVATPGGTSPVSPADQFTFTAAPIVTSVDPAQGPTSGGTVVSVVGSNFAATTAVDFGTGAPASAWTVVSSTLITTTAPSHAPATVDVTVTTLQGTSQISAADHYSFVAACSPAVASVTPDEGPAAGGTAVTIVGTNLAAATAVDFGTGAPASAWTVVSATVITATSPGGSAGAVDVTVTTPCSGSAPTPADQFTYLPPPAVTGVTPALGPTSGGAGVVVGGSGFTGATTVDFGNADPAPFTVVNDTEIVADAPAAPAGTVDVTVSVPVAGSSARTPADQFTYVAPPTVATVSPASGPDTGGTAVTVNGANFVGVSAVDFGPGNPAAFSVLSATQISLTTPSGADGATDVSVTAVGGTGTGAGAFTYLPENCDPPSFSSPSATTAVAGVPFSFTVTTCNTAVPVIRGSGLPRGLLLVNNHNGTATIAGTPSPTDSGPYAATLTATVTGQTPATQHLTVTVDNVAVFRSKAKDTVHTGVAFSFSVTTRYGYPPPAIATMSTLPSGVTLTDHGNGTAALAGTPGPAAGGNYPIVIAATNGVKAGATQTFTLVVDQAPAITSAAGDTITAGVPVTPFTVTDTGYPLPRLRASGLPSGVTLTDQPDGSGTIAGQAQASAVGTHIVTITASSSAGTTTQSFMLTVNP